jgi:lambda family phage portal protein
MNTDNFKMFQNILIPRAAGYDIAKPNVKRRRTYVAAKDEDRLITASDRQQIRKETRNAYRNNSLVRAIHDRIVTAAVGSYGLLPQSEATDKDFRKTMESAFNEWSKIADYRQRADLVELQRMTVSHLLLDGEIFFIQLSNGQIQPIEAERVFTPDKYKADPDVIDGIRLDGTGKILGYYFAKRNDQGYADMSNHEYVLAKNVIHVRMQNRIDQIRGISSFAPALEKIIDLMEFESAILMKAKAEAKRGYAIKSDSAEVAVGNLGDRFGGGNTSADEIRYERILDGTVYYLNENESIDSLETKTPHASYQSYIDSLVTEICSCLGVSSEWILNKFNTSYIASRASMITTETTIESYQLSLEIQLMQRLWNWQVFKQSQAGNITKLSFDGDGKPDWFKVNWIYNRLPNLDDKAIADADAAQWKNCTTSLTRMAKQKGFDFDTLLSERTNEARKIIESAEKFNIPLWMLFPPSAGLPIQNIYETPNTETKG